ncbi:MAG: hypothetical protein AAB466_11955 [Verrucomicrobiota bacterium]
MKIIKNLTFAALAVTLLYPMKRAWTTPLLALSFAGALAGAFPAAADPILYATAERGAMLIKIDVASGDVTTIGNASGALGIAFAPDGKAYSITESCTACAGVPRLVTVDLPTASIITGVPVSPRMKFKAIVCSPQGILYGVDGASGSGSGSFFIIDPTTGKATRLGASGAAVDIMDLAFHPDGTLYGIEGTRLYTIDPVTGKRTLAKQLRGVTDVMGLAITADGAFYAADYTSPSPLVRIDVGTGQTTPVVRTKLNLIHGLDLLPPPAMNITWQGDRVVVTWPAWAAGHVLQSTASLSADASWTTSPGAPVTVGDRITASLDASDPARFFRLVKP